MNDHGNARAAARIFAHEGWLYLRIHPDGEALVPDAGTEHLRTFRQLDREDFPAFERRVRAAAEADASVRGLRIGF